MPGKVRIPCAKCATAGSVGPTAPLQGAVGTAAGGGLAAQGDRETESRQGIVR